MTRRFAAAFRSLIIWARDAITFLAAATPIWAARVNRCSSFHVFEFPVCQDGSTLGGRAEDKLVDDFVVRVVGLRVPEESSKVEIGGWARPPGWCSWSVANCPDSRFFRWRDARSALYRLDSAAASGCRNL